MLPPPAQADFAPASNHNPLDLIERDLILPLVVRAGGARTRMIRHLLRHLQLAPIAQVLRNPRRPERMVANLSHD